MILADLIAVVVLAIILSFILIWGFGWRHPANRRPVGASLLFLFFVLALSMWGAGAWLPPWESAWGGARLASLLLIGFFVSLLILSIAAPAKNPLIQKKAEEEDVEEAKIVGTVFSLFFWLLILGLITLALLSHWS